MIDQPLEDEVTITCTRDGAFEATVVYGHVLTHLAVHESLAAHIQGLSLSERTTGLRLCYFTNDVSLARAVELAAEIEYLFDDMPAADVSARENQSEAFKAWVRANNSRFKHWKAAHSDEVY